MKKENLSEKAYELSEKIVKDVNDFYGEFITEDGRITPSQDMVKALGVIIEEGFVLYKYVVENKIYEGKANITADVLELEKHMTTLEMTEENSKKLDLQSAMNAWKAFEVIIAKLACDLLDFRDGLN
jgi:hypothetical protein